MESKKAKKQENLLFFSWAVSVVATLGSLYFSEIQQFEPCELCWYQRILMYPLTIILGIAAVKKQAGIAIYTAVLSGIGACFSLYHYLIQKADFFSSSAPACGRVPCTGQYINWMGFITIPFLALVAFSIILIVSVVLLKSLKGEKQL
ncbi:disulfide oxidoreductase [Siminovitchia sediminis]|uniref:Probable disulfide formation protein n=1 Tax=Siminovitchia sediminis TaxID=1274353 RepID=A0ABW4KJB6_9BACI